MRRLSVVLVWCFAACGPAASTTNPCENGGGAAPAPLVTGRGMKNLAVTGAHLVYVDTAGRGALRRANLDGSDDVELYAAPPQHRLFDSIVVDDTVWLFEQESALTGVITRIRKVPVAGGAATSLTLTEQPAFFLRHEASPQRFFVRVANSGSEMGVVFEMAPDGALTRLLGPKNLEDAHVTDDAVFFMYRPSIGDDATSRALHRAARSADAADEQVGDVHCRGAFLPLASGGFLCAGYTSTGVGSPSSVLVTALDANGGNPRTLFDYSKSDLAGAHAWPAVQVGDEAVVAFNGSGDAWPLLAVNVDTGAARALACGVTAPREDIGSGKPELVVVGDSVYWIGQGARGVPPDTIFRVPLR